MKAAVFYTYGNPGVLRIEERDKPIPGKDELLVRIMATAVNSGDVRLRKADPFAVRFMLGLRKPKINILGGVFSGIIEAVGSDVKQFKIGDEVFGSTDLKFGTYAEYKCFRETDSIALKPKSISHEEAAVLPFGATTAMYFLEKVKLKSGDKILILGASGAVGTAAVQLAKNSGAIVTAVCSGKNTELVRGLGADRVIDYTSESVFETHEKYDVIYETINRYPVAGCFKLLAKKGRLILGAAGLCEMLGGKFRALFRSQNVFIGMISHNTATMKTISSLAEQGKLKAVIDQQFSLEEIAKAHAFVETGHKKGNVAISIK